MKEIARLLWWTALFLFAAFCLYGDFVSALHAPREGERCGPEHHWRAVGDPIDPDLSCEPD